MKIQRTQTGYRYEKVEVDTAGRISPRSAQLLACAATGKQQAECAVVLGIKPHSAAVAFQRLYFQLGARNLAEAIYIAATHKWLRYTCAITLVLFTYLNDGDAFRREATARVRTTRTRTGRAKRKRDIVSLDDLIA